MNGKLIDVATVELLEKFGAGNHKPGSGSASAFQGMLSAKMILTVIELTSEPKRHDIYKQHLPRLTAIKGEIELRIYDRLEYLFQTDSDEFDKVIRLRERRDAETDPLKQSKLSKEAQEALKLATQIPLEIAELCLELGGFAAYVFDNGFKSARGDTGVALHGAISGVASCLSIIDLNLTSLSFSEWTEKVRKHKMSVKDRYIALQLAGEEKLEILEKEAEENYLFSKSIDVFRRGNLADSIRSNAEIEEIVKQLQNILWKHRSRVWKKNVPENPMQVLKPGMVLKKIMDYTYVQLDTLGSYKIDGELFEIAGLIDKRQKLVQVSKSFPKETQNFTAAHELGHAILHNQNIMHRDKPLDGSASVSRNIEEMQADKFATYFLMPATIVKAAFERIFQVSTFSLNEDTSLALGYYSIVKLRQQCQDTRGLARLLSSTENYNGKKFNNLAKFFGVSVETMAIRLEELFLLEF